MKKPSWFPFCPNCPEVEPEFITEGAGYVVYYCYNCDHSLWMVVLDELEQKQVDEE